MDFQTVPFQRHGLLSVREVGIYHRLVLVGVRVGESKYLSPDPAAEIGINLIADDHGVIQVFRHLHDCAFFNADASNFFIMAVTASRSPVSLFADRSEERRVGKECRSRW